MWRIRTAACCRRRIVGPDGLRREDLLVTIHPLGFFRRFHVQRFPAIVSDAAADTPRDSSDAKLLATAVVE